MDVFRNIAVGDLLQPFLLDFGKAAQLRHLSGHIFQNIVHKGAHLGRGELRRLTGAGLQSVLEEIGEGAGGHFVYAAGGKAQGVAVKAAHRPAAESAPAQRGGRAKALKLFPADSVPLGYCKAMKGPFPDADFVAVGGVTPQNTAAFLKAGYIGVGFGSSLAKKELFEQKNWSQIAADIATAQLDLEG